MVEQDTIRLLRECDAGVKMGIASLDDVLGYVHAQPLKELLDEGKQDHKKLENEIQSLLTRYHDDGKEPPAMAKGMSWIKTNMKLSVDGSDATVSDLITDGCNMGIKTLNKYLNQYEAADEKSKGIAKKLIELEKKLALDISPYL